MNTHDFEVKTYTSPTNCSLCDGLLVGLRHQGHQCKSCKINVHSRCLEPCGSKIACINAAQTDSSIPHTRLHEQEKTAHSFAVHTFMKPTFCAVCHKLLPGLFKQGLQCANCKLPVHHACRHAATSSIDCDSSRLSPTQTSGMNLSAARKNLQAAVRKGMRRLASTGGNDAVHEISGPTNFKHVAGTSGDRVLISLEEARRRLAASSHGGGSAKVERDRSMAEAESEQPGQGGAGLASSVERLTVSEDLETLAAETKVSETTSSSALRKEAAGGGAQSLPAGWVQLFDETSKQPYYFNESRFVTQWERPDC